MSLSPKLLYQGSALLFLLSAYGHAKTGWDIVGPSLKPLGESQGAVIAKMGWMTGCGYLLACSVMIHRFSYTPAEQFTSNDTLFIVLVWITNLYGAWTFVRAEYAPGAVLLLLRSSLLITARLLQVV